MMSNLIEVKTKVFDAATGEVSYITSMEEVECAPLTIEEYRIAVQAHIDSAAQSRLYESGATLATYANSTNGTWAAEAQAFIAWRDAVWAYVYALWRDPPETAPTVEELITALPAITWP